MPVFVSSAPLIVGVRVSGGPKDGQFISKGQATGDTTPIVYGSAAPNRTVTIYVDNVVVATTVAANNGTWSVEITMTGDGMKAITATATDSDGESAQSSPYAVELLTAVPPEPSQWGAVDNIPPDVGEIQSGSKTDDNQPVISGQGEPDTTIIIRDNGIQIAEVVVESDGLWTFTPSGPLGEGQHSLTVQAMNDLGVVSVESAPLDFIVDTHPITIAITDAEDNVGLIRDPVLDGGRTDDSTPTLRGTVTPGATVTIFDDEGTLLTTFIADTTGNWSYTLPVQSEGEHTYKAVATNTAGTEVVAEFTLTVDTTAPSATSVVTGIENDTGISNSDFITSDQQLIIHGRLEGALGNGEKIQISIDGGQWADVSYDAVTGTWSYDNQSEALSHGEHIVQTRLIDDVGNITEPSEQKVIVDTEAPNVIAAITAIVDDTGESDNDFVTADDTLIFRGTVNGVLEQGDIIQIRIDNGAWLEATYDAASSQWSFDNQATPLSNGPHSIETRIIDLAGNVGGLDSKTITIDPTAVANATSYISSITEDTGPNASDFVTRDQTLIFNGYVDGTISTNDRVQICFDGYNWLDVQFDHATGNWVYNATYMMLTEGLHRIETRVLTAGGVELNPTYQDVIIDLTNPTSMAEITSISNDSGISHIDFITNEQKQIFYGTVDAQLEAHEQIEISFDGVNWVEVDIDRINNTWSYDNTANDLPEGINRVYTRVIDGAGNIGLNGYKDIIIDITPPAASSTIIKITEDTGLSQNDFITSDSRLIFSGKVDQALNDGEIIQISIDNGQWIDVNYDAATQTWTYDNSQTSLTEGAHTVSTRVVDAAGNETGPTDITVVIDTQAPMGISILTGIINDTGINNNDFITSDQRLIFEGRVDQSLGSGEKVQISFDNTYWFDVVYDAATQTWSYDNTNIALPEGATTVYTRIIDAAGNVGGNSHTNVVVDLTPPSAGAYVNAISDDTGIAGDFITSDQTLIFYGRIDGSLHASEHIEIRIGDNGPWLVASYNPATGIWSYDNQSQILPEDTYNIYTRVVDAAGNAGNETVREITIDLSTSQAKAVVTGIDTDTGLSSNDFITSDSSLYIFGNVSGTLADDERIQIRIDNGGWLDVIYDHVTGTWSYDNRMVDLTQGRHVVETRIIDESGNIGLISDQEIIIDQTSPNATAQIFSISEDDGLSNSDFITSDQTLVISAKLSGTLQADERVQISLNGGVTWQNAIYNAGTDTWDLDNTNNVLAYGRYEFQVRVIDLAGNYDANAVDSREVLIVSDVPAATATITNYVDDYGPIQSGNMQSGSYTDDVTPTLQGHLNIELEADQRVAIYRGNELVGYATVNENAPTYWQFTDSSLLNGNSYTYHAVVVNLAGNNGPISNDFEIRIDTADSSFAPNIGKGPDSYSTAVALGQNGEWVIVSDQSIYHATGNGFGSYSGQQLAWDRGANAHIAGQYPKSPTFGAYTLADFNRDGFVDIFTTDKTYDGATGTMFFGNNSGGVNSASLVNTGTTTHFGAVMALDMDGDGYLDVMLGDSSNDSMTFLHNRGPLGNGNYYNGQWDIYGRSSGLTSSTIARVIVDHEVSGVDLNNDGTIDFVGHAYEVGGNVNSLKILLNNGTSSRFGGNWSQGQTINNVFNTSGVNDDSFDRTVSMTWADFNGDGYLDLFIGQSRLGNYQTSDSQIFYNNGDGTLASEGQRLNDNVWGKTSVAVDWDGDGHIDVIEIPEAGYLLGQSVLHRNTGELNNSGQTIWSYHNISAIGTATTTNGQVDLNSIKGASGATLVDYDWDGALDLIISTRGDTPSVLIGNPNKPEEGTALHLRILNPDGSNTFYGNTVQLYDSHGNLVASQILNAQSGSGQNDGTGLVHFYGLDKNETYSAVLLHNRLGVSSDFGGVHYAKGENAVENYNSTWNGLKAGFAHDAFVLTAERDGNSSTAQYGNGIVGTGYNDTFFAMQGTHIYNGGGGWNMHGGVKNWSATGGLDIIDFQQAGFTSVRVDLSSSVGQNTGFGTVRLVNIEGASGGNGADLFYDSTGDNIFNGRGGNDTFYLTKGGHDTLMYETIDSQDARGGNGWDVVYGFSVGDFTNPNNDADCINLSDLLIGYSADADGPAHWVNGIARIDAGDDITAYLSMRYDGSNTVLYVDRDGAGGQFGETALITFNNTNLDLATLLANHQIVV